MDVGVGFADRAAVVVSVGFSQDLWVLHISICITPEAMSTFDPAISSIICLFESSTCFEQLCAHLQEGNCINTTSGIISLC